MAAPYIPNLNTLRSLKGPSRTPGRPQENLGNSLLRDEEGQFAKDKIVQHTDQDASVSRLSAVEIGYLADPYARLFASMGGQRRFPIINRGVL